MHFYSKNDFQWLFIVKLFSNEFLIQKSFPMYFIGKIISKVLLSDTSEKNYGISILGFLSSSK